MVHIGPKISTENRQAFYPITPSLKGVHFTSRVCTGSIVLGRCIFGDWKVKDVEFLFSDLEMMKWFKANDMGFYQRPKP